MLVIFGVTLPSNKKVRYALPMLFGLGQYSANKICNELGYSPNLTVGDLNADQQFEISKKIKTEYRIELHLREEIKGNVQRYISNGSIRGFRHKNKLPVRGQRTQTNAKTPRKMHLGLINTQ
jgi:small subunit ribosomal protein S13